MGASSCRGPRCRVIRAAGLGCLPERSKHLHGASVAVEALGSGGPLSAAMGGRSGYRGAPPTPPPHLRCASMPEPHQSQRAVFGAAWCRPMPLPACSSAQLAGFVSPPHEVHDRGSGGGGGLVLSAASAEPPSLRTSIDLATGGRLQRGATGGVPSWMDAAAERGPDLGLKLARAFRLLRRP
jgi:hypothetical protein